MNNSHQGKINAAEAAIQYIKDDMVIGVGTGSTVNFFIKALSSIKHKIEGAVASSLASAKLLKDAGISVIDLNNISDLPLYIDGADEINLHKQMIKGGGGALTREKIVASVAKCFICIADANKAVPMLGNFPIAVEVIPMARSYVAREIVRIGGDPAYREGFVTDNGNLILDVYNLTLDDPLAMEIKLKQIPGVIENGIFAKRRADILLLGNDTGVAITE